MSMYAYMYVSMHMCMCTCGILYCACMCMHNWVCAYVCMWYFIVYLCMWVCICTCMCVRLWMCVCICVYVIPTLWMYVDVYFYCLHIYFYAYVCVYVYVCACVKLHSVCKCVYMNVHVTHYNVYVCVWRVTNDTTPFRNRYSDSRSQWNQMIPASLQGQALWALNESDSFLWLPLLGLPGWDGGESWEAHMLALWPCIFHQSLSQSACGFRELPSADLCMAAASFP